MRSKLRPVSSLTCRAVFLVFSGSAGAAAGEATQTALDSAIFSFGGAMTHEDMFFSANPLFTEYEKNVLFGAGYQQLYWEAPYDLSFGIEVGVAGRFGSSASAEFWGGLVGRYDGFTLSETLHITPAITFGLSTVTDTAVGRETEQEIEDDGNARVLFYLSPEFSFSLASRPEVELFWRLHHRSGAWGLLGNMHGASNANVVGLRWRF